MKYPSCCLTISHQCLFAVGRRVVNDIDSYGNVLSTTAQCVITPGGQTWGILAVAMHVILLMIGFYLGAMTQQAPKKFSDMQNAFGAMISSAQLLTIGTLMLMFLSSMEAIFMLEALIVSANDLIILALIFYDKVARLYENESKKSAMSGSHLQDINITVMSL